MLKIIKTRKALFVVGFCNIHLCSVQLARDEFQRKENCQTRASRRKKKKQQKEKGDHQPKKEKQK